MNKLFGFEYGYPQSFLDYLAKMLGVKWVKSPFKLIPKEDIEIVPLSPPTGVIHYIDMEYRNE